MNPLLTMSLHWLRPQCLWLLAGLPLLAWWWRGRWRQRNAWREAVDPHLLPHLLDSTPPLRRMRGPWLALLGTALAIAALAGPSWQRAPQPEWQNRAPLVIAVDLSTAVLATDLPPSRLLQARAKIARMLQSRAGGQVGLVVFADDAFTVAPLTDDVANVALFLDALEPDVMPVDGSRADRAIAWSARLLRQAGFDHGDILLLTDHADTAARGEATSASRGGYRVSVLGMGTPSGAAYRDAEGRIGHAALDASSLRDVASAGGGDYAAMTTNNDDLSHLDVLDPQHAGAMSAQGRSTLVWLDQGYWLLPPLLVLGLLAFRRGRGLAVLLLVALMPWQPAQAATQDLWRRPDQLAHDRIEQGAQAYRKGDFATAQALWQHVPVADAAYNRGNALARQGNYDEAIAAYDEALRLQPGMADALANRRAVEAARKRKPPPGKQSGQGKDNPQQGAKGQSQAGAGQQQGQSKAQPQDGGRAAGQKPEDARQPPPQSGKQSPAAAGTQPPKAGDATAQRQADAAQRARMQRALQQAKANGNSRGAEAQRRVETRAERERRLANEAWLQRVPDDPGGLLRAKFRLEFERRQQEGE